MTSMRFLAACLLVAIASTCSGDPVWIGTYTGGEAGSEGIYVADFDPATGRLSEPRLAAKAKNPSFLAAHPTRPVLFAVSEVSDADGKPGGAIAALAIDEATGGLTEINTQPSGGTGPCHVSIDVPQNLVLAANYGSGSVACFRIADDGSLEPAAAGSPGGVLQHPAREGEEAGINASRQEGPHAHSIYPSPGGKYVIACDLGLDTLFVHALDAKRGTLDFHSKVKLPPGSGPRHFSLHSCTRYGYVVNEMALTVTFLGYDATTGEFTPEQTLSTLPDDVTDREGFSTAEVICHPAGIALFASNRGHDSIAMYTVDRYTGRLTFRGVTPIGGKTPRGFTVDPSGRYLLVAGQDSNTITVFSIDFAQGTLTSTGQTVSAPKPVCLAFRPPVFDADTGKP